MKNTRLKGLRRPPLPLSTTLPGPARQLLIKAAAEKAHRAKAIDHAIEKVKQMYPLYFQRSTF